MSSSPREVTQLLIAWSNGDQTALDQLIPLIYGELRRVARRYMRRERAGHTLQTMALVNEAYLGLIDANQVQWQDRAHFYAISAQLMRRILIDYARSHNYVKRGGEARHLALEEAAVFSVERAQDLVALDDALKSLAAFDPRKSQVVELRFFGGLSVEETAEVLKVSPRTVLSDWSLAKAWLLRELSNTGEGAD